MDNLNIVFITLDTPRGRLIAKALSKRIRLSLIIFQKYKEQELSKPLNKIDLLFSFLREKATIKYLEEPFCLDGILCRKILVVDNINSDITKKILHESDIDISFYHNTNLIENEILNIPKLGSVNMHHSLLPYYKGAASEFWQQLNNNDFNSLGLTFHYMDKGLDTGNIIKKIPLSFNEGDNFYDLQCKNMMNIIIYFKEVVKLIKTGVSIPQEKIEQSYIYKKRNFNITSKIEYLNKVDFKDKIKLIERFNLGEVVFEK